MGNKQEDFDRYRRLQGWNIGDKLRHIPPFVFSVRMGDLYVKLVEHERQDSGPWAAGQTIEDAVGAWWKNHCSEYEIVKKPV
jgi:hypothetical protein